MVVQPSHLRLNRPGDLLSGCNVKPGEVERAGDDLPLECPYGEGGVLVAAPVFDHKEFTADIRDTQLFSLGFNVFHGPGGYLAYLCNFDLLSLVS